MATTKRIGVLIDYETRSRVDIKIHGNSRYARDPSTEVMCLCAADVYKEGSKFRVDRKAKYLYDFRNQSDVDHITDFLPQAGELMFAFNAGFEYLITNETLGIPFPIDSMYCLQLTCLYNGLPASLDAVSKAVPLRAPKDEEGHRLMIKMCQPDKKTGEFPYSNKMQDRLLQYCEQDIEAEAEILERLPAVPEYELECFRETLRMNMTGVPVDLELTEKSNVLSGIIGDDLQAQFPDINLKSHTQIKKFCDQHGFPIESTDKEHVAEYLANPLTPKPVKALLEIKAAGVGSSSVSKFDAVMNFTDSDGQLRNAYRHHGAVRTGRWTSQGVQIQNLPRGEKSIVEKDKLSGRWFLSEVRDYIRKGDLDSLYLVTGGRPMDAMRSVIRTLFAPPPGKKFVQRDLSAIEARGAFWVAGAEKLQMFFDFDAGIGKEPYMIFAEELGADRFMGKQGLLSTNYGIGRDTLMTLCATQGRKITEGEAKHCLDLHKSMFPEVKDFWYKIDVAAKKALERPMEIFMVDTPTNSVKFISDGLNLRMKLPSERVITYWDAKLQPGNYGPEITYMAHGSEAGKAMGWHRTRTWGGAITGHIVQGFSACIMRHIALEMTKAGLPPCMLVHDEAVTIADEASAELVFTKMGEIMNNPPAWAAGLPVESAGWIGDFYVKG